MLFKKGFSQSHRGNSRWLFAALCLFSGVLGGAEDDLPTTWWALEHLTVDGFDRITAASHFQRETMQLAWEERWRVRYRELGTALWARDSESPLKWHWLAETIKNPPGYWVTMAESDWSGERLVTLEEELVARGASSRIDVDQRRKWELQFALWRAQSGAAWGGNYAQEIDCGEFQNRLNHQYNFLDAGFYATPVGTTQAISTLGEVVTLVQKYPQWNSKVAWATVARLCELSPWMRPLLSESLEKIPNASARELAKKLRDLSLLHSKDSVIAGTTLGGTALKVPTGKFVFLQTWNVFCGSCIEHLSKTQAVATRWPDKVSVVSWCFQIAAAPEAFEPERKRAAELLKANGATFPSLFTTYEDFCQFGFNWSLAAYYLFDANGHLIVASHWQEDVVRRLEQELATQESRAGTAKSNQAQ